MRETFELYLRRKQGPGEFVAVTCLREQVLDHARDLLERSEGEEVEVRRAGEHLFTLAR